VPATESGPYANDLWWKKVHLLDDCMKERSRRAQRVVFYGAMDQVAKKDRDGMRLTVFQEGPWRM